MSRKIEDLTPEMQAKYKAFKDKMGEMGIDFIITCTFRSQEDQNLLYAQGRTSPGRIVTWTLHSRHTQRDAFDIALLLENKPVWDVKVDVDHDHIPDYQEAGEIGESVGLVWGGRWTKPDYPHFQFKEV